MGSGRGDRNQLGSLSVMGHGLIASMGSGRGDRNQMSTGLPMCSMDRRFNGVRSW